MSGYPIICLHGLADNCYSFMPISPLLSQKHQYIALDAMGHGLTTHVPPGVVTNVWDFVMHIRRLAEYLNISKFSILGHRYKMEFILANFSTNELPSNKITVWEDHQGSCMRLFTQMQ